jgi:hypothetical protein
MTKNSDVKKKYATKSMKLLLKSPKNATWNKKMLALNASNFENSPPYKNGYQVASIIGKGQVHGFQKISVRIRHPLEIIYTMQIQRESSRELRVESCLTT